MNQRFCNGMIHVIRSGDNLYQLSRRYRVPLALILRANPYVDVYKTGTGNLYSDALWKRTDSRTGNAAGKRGDNRTGDRR